MIPRQSLIASRYSSSSSGKIGVKGMENAGVGLDGSAWLVRMEMMRACCSDKDLRSIVKAFAKRVSQSASLA
jgi:hypothetical protein